MHLRDDAGTTQRAADASGLVFHALVVLPHPEDRLALGEGDPHAFPELLARMREKQLKEGTTQPVF